MTWITTSKWMSVSHRIRKLIRKTQHLCRRTKKFRATKIQSLTHSSPATASLSTWSTSKISQASLSLWDNLSLNNRMMPPPKIRKKLTIIFWFLEKSTSLFGFINLLKRKSIISRSCHAQGLFTTKNIFLIKKILRKWKLF